MFLKDKIAVVYGAGGAIGGAVASAFAREGARVFLTGRTLPPLQRMAERIAAEGHATALAQVDALDEHAVEEHLTTVVAQTGGIDISFNAIWIRGDLQGTPLIEMTSEHFMLPVVTAAKTHFLTTTAAARHMVRRGSGVILTLSTSAAGLSGRDRRFHATGGFGTACAAIEGLSRSLAGELGPKGIRVVCLRSNGVPETWTQPQEKTLTYMEDSTALGRLPTLREVGEAAVLMASDRASAITGAITNLTCGSIID